MYVKMKKSRQIIKVVLCYDERRKGKVIGKKNKSAGEKYITRNGRC